MIGFSNHGALARVPEREWPHGANSDNGVSIQKMVTPNVFGQNMVTPDMTWKIFKFSIFNFSIFNFFTFF